MAGITERVTSRQGWLALSSMLLFMLSYVAVSVYIGDFYKMPISVAHENILYMIGVFVLAGVFSTLATKLAAVDKI